MARGEERAQVHQFGRKFRGFGWDRERERVHAEGVLGQCDLWGSHREHDLGSAGEETNLSLGTKKWVTRRQLCTEPRSARGGRRGRGWNL